jgi:hypothetical protein
MKTGRGMTSFSALALLSLLFALSPLGCEGDGGGGGARVDEGEDGGGDGSGGGSRPAYEIFLRLLDHPAKDSVSAVAPLGDDGLVVLGREEGVGWEDTRVFWYDGEGWTKRPITSERFGGRDLYAFSADDVLVLGEMPDEDFDYDVVVFRGNQDGFKKSRVAEAADLSALGMWVAGPTDIYVYGTGGYSLEGTSRMFHYVDGQWVEETLPAGAVVVRVWGLEPGLIYAVGRGGVVLMSDGQGSWTTLREASDDDLTLWAIWGTAPNALHVAGGTSYDNQHSKDRSAAYRWDGSAWSEAPFEDELGEDIRDMAGLSDGTIYGVGEWGYMYRFDGQSWRTRTYSTTPSGAGDDLRRMTLVERGGVPVIYTVGYDHAYSTHCASGETRCVGEDIFACRDDGLSFGFKEACGAKGVCEEDDATTDDPWSAAGLEYLGFLPDTPVKAASCEICEPHDDKGCREGDVYWFDSCGQQEDLAEACPEGEVCKGGACVEDVPDPPSPSCSLECSNDGNVGLTCGTGSMSCSNSYDSHGRVSHVSCTYSNGKSFSCSISYNSLGQASGSCSGEGDSCYFHE